MLLENGRADTIFPFIMNDAPMISDREANPPSAGEAWQDERRVEKGFWRKIRKTAGQIPFSEDAVAAWYCARDEKTPARIKGILFAALGYFIVPTDMIPDFIAGFGFADDASVLTAAMTAISAYMRPRHYAKAQKALLKIPKKPNL